MPNVLLNGSAYMPDAAISTWNDLLGTIDTHLDTQGQAVAAVRFDGVDEPGFRDPQTLARPLAPATIVEVESDTPAGLILRGLEEASASVPEIAQAAVALAARYRLADVSDADGHLAAFAQALGHLMALVAAASQVLEVNLRDVTAGGASVAETMTRLDAAVTALLEAHAGQDWITLADSLEYDVAPLVGRLREVVEHLASVTA